MFSFQGGKYKTCWHFKKKYTSMLSGKLCIYSIGKNHRYKISNMLTFRKKYTWGIILCIKNPKKVYVVQQNCKHLSIIKTI